MIRIIDIHRHFVMPGRHIAGTGHIQEVIMTTRFIPVASLISVPFQFNYDQDIGALDDGERFTLNFQPVVPVSISDDWNMISRTIVPLTSQDDIVPAADSQSGLGDITQSLFFSPKQPTAGGLIWGVGPVFLLPSASDDLPGVDKWGIGPTRSERYGRNRWGVFYTPIATPS
jgi:hypothetical protein